MGYVEPVSRDEVEGFEEVFEKRDANFGFVSNAMLTMAHRPEIFRAYLGFLDAVYHQGLVDHELKMLVALMRSKAAGCRYCQAHTSTRAAQLNVSEQKIQAIWEFESSPLFTDAERSALRLAQAAAMSPNAADASHFADLSRFYTDPEIVEIVSVISLFAFLNSFNDTLATELEGIPLEIAGSTIGSLGWHAGKHETAG